MKDETERGGRSIDAVFNRVLGAERDAREAVAACRRDADALVARAERDARDISRRAERRIRSAHAIADRGIERALAKLREPTMAESDAEQAPAADEIEDLVQVLARELTEPTA